MIIKDREDLTSIIKRSLKACGMSVTQLGERMNVLQPSISRTITRSDITVTDLVKICDAMGCVLEINIYQKIPTEE